MMETAKAVMVFVGVARIHPDKSGCYPQIKNEDNTIIHYGEINRIKRFKEEGARSSGEE